MLGFLSNILSVLAVSCLKVRTVSNGPAQKLSVLKRLVFDNLYFCVDI